MTDKRYVALRWSWYLHNENEPTARHIQVVVPVDRIEQGREEIRAKARFEGLLTKPRRTWEYMYHD